MARPRLTVSLEFFAPKTPEGLSRLRHLWSELGPLAPAYFSVTCATDEGGPERTLRTVQALRSHFGPGVDIAPHLTCVGSSRESLRRRLTAYRSLDIRHLVLIRGDLPPGMREWTGELAHARDLPITNLERLTRFSEAAGVEIPRWLRKRIEGLPDPQARQAFGIDVVTRLCRRLLEVGTPGLHFYTMNSAEPVRTIWSRLALG